MAEAAPVVYILHGEDEFGIAQFVAAVEAKLGDPSMAAMNITRMEGRNFNLEDLRAAANSMPFLADRRVVILSDFVDKIKGKPAQDRFKDLLENLPESTALLLIEHQDLTPYKKRKEGKLHWLEDWAQQVGSRAFVKQYPPLRGGELTRWIMSRAQEANGQITPQAASLLGSLVGEDPRLADQEVLKLLTYVNFRRAVDIDDVQALTADSSQADIFALVDSLALQDGRQAMKLLRRLQEQEEPMGIFFMIVRQFRLLILAREVLNEDGPRANLTRRIGVHPYVAGKLTAQARRFDLALLEQVYHRLMDLDEAVKTGQMPVEMTLDLFVAAFTAQQP